MIESQGHIIPFWNIKNFYNLEYTLSMYQDADHLDNFVKAGHVINCMTLYNYFEPNYMPDDLRNHIIKNFSFLDHLSIAINLFKPGQYIPYHKDLYTKYKKFHNIPDNKNIWRGMLMLEDGHPGQILEIKNKTHSFWKAGDWFAWTNQDSHASYNFSLTDRYAVQITGTIDG